MVVKLRDSSVEMLHLKKKNHTSKEGMVCEDAPRSLAVNTAGPVEPRTRYQRGDPKLGSALPPTRPVGRNR